MIRAPGSTAGSGLLGPALATLAAVVVFGLVFGLSALGGDSSSQLGLIVVGLPAVAASGFLAARRPVWSVAAAVFLTAFAGTLATNQGIPPKFLDASIWLLLLGLVAAMIAGYLNVSRPRQVAIWPGAAALAAYLIFTAFSIPFAETADIGTKAFIAGPAFIVAFFGLAYLQWGPDVRWRIAQAFVLVALMVGAYALYRLLGGPTAAELAVTRKSGGVAGELTLIGSFGSRQQLSGWCAVAIPFVFAFVVAARGRWRWVGTGALALLIVALLGSEVRTALVAAAVGLALGAVLFQAARAFKSERLTALMAIAALAVPGMVGFTLTVGSDPESAERFARIVSPGEDKSFQSRLLKWDAALAEINEHPFGQGLGTTGTTQRLYSRTYRLDNRYIDNSYLQLGVQQGYPGWILLGASVLMIGYMLLRSTLAAVDWRLAAIGIGAAASLAAWLVTLWTGEMLTAWAALLLWMLLGLAVGGFVRPTPGRANR